LNTPETTPTSIPTNLLTAPENQSTLRQADFIGKMVLPDRIELSKNAPVPLKTLRFAASLGRFV
jgi:hypothetical protein